MYGTYWNKTTTNFIRRKCGGTNIMCDLESIALKYRLKL